MPDDVSHNYPSLDDPRPGRSKSGPSKSSRNWKEWLIPRSITGLTVIILAFAIGASLSGVSLYAYYSYRLSSNEDRIEKFVGGFDENFDNAQKTIEADKENAKAEIEEALEPLRQTRADGETLVNLVRRHGDAVWFVETLNEDGEPSVGSAFVVQSESNRSLLITSHTTINASTRRPGPSISVRKGNQRVGATLHTWDEDKDLALLTINRGNLPKLKFVPKDPPLKLGTQVFAMSGLGSAGGTATFGFVIDVSSSGIQHTSPIGVHFQGGPLINTKGEVVAIASRSYAPFGFRSTDVYFGPTIRMACQQILSCPDDEEVDAGTKQ